MSPLGAVHVAFSLVALGSGAVVLLLRKGTRWHRTWGHVYATSMVALSVTALFLYRLTGSFGPFHVAAIVALVTLTAGLFSVLARRPRKAWIESHAIWMSWSYIGLVAAFCAETATRVLLPRVADVLAASESWGLFWSAVGLATFGVCGVGAWIVRTRLPASVAATPEAMRREREALEAR